MVSVSSRIRTRVTVYLFDNEIIVVEQFSNRKYKVIVPRYSFRNSGLHEIISRCLMSMVTYENLENVTEPNVCIYFTNIIVCISFAHIIVCTHFTNIIVCLYFANTIVSIYFTNIIAGRDLTNIIIYLYFTNSIFCLYVTNMSACLYFTNIFCIYFTNIIVCISFININDTAHFAYTLSSCILQILKKLIRRKLFQENHLMRRKNKYNFLPIFYKYSCLHIF